MSSKKRSNRPKNRTLVRWDDNLDELLLLTVQSVCNTQSVKIPWGEVARTMGHNVTEGAIVQHLAKLRSRRIAAAKDVPPPLRRGGVGSSVKPTPTNTPPVKRKKRNDNDSEGGGEVLDTFLYADDSSDEDYVVSGRSRRQPQKKRSKPRRKNKITIKIESDTEEDDIKHCTPDSEELLVPGAAFLDFPNDRESSQSSGSSPSSPDVPSKIVVLNYTRSTGAMSNTPHSAQADPAPGLLNMPGNPTYQSHGQHFPHATLSYERSGSGLEVSTTHNMGAGYMPSFDSSLGMSSIDPQLALGQYASLQSYNGLPSSLDSDYQNVTYSDSNGMMDYLSSDMFPHADTFFNQNLDYLGTGGDFESVEVPVEGQGFEDFKGIN